ncbi:TnsD family Tn7-like transposition protein [Bacillus cereus]|uniref:TnsD family Tn7-like transposition protein n=1 Tax=Bacillus cereus TaxID=1396 RepID=UPI001443C032|nr:transposase [Bacillus cereus]
MLGFLPKLYEDELLYSWCARYHICLKNDSPKQTMEELFNKRSQIAVADLPTNLEFLSNQINTFMNYTVDDLIGKHTLYHYYTNFCQQNIKEEIKSIMKLANKQGAIHMMAGIMANKVKDKKYFSFCPKCFEEDKKERGEFYWRLIHQLPSVLICTKHKSFLQQSSVPFRPNSPHKFIAPSIETCITNKNISQVKQKNLKHLLVIAQQSQQVALYEWNFSWEQLQNCYKYLLQHKGLASVTGVVDQKELANQFQRFYGEELLILLQSPVNYEDKSCWLKEITRKLRKTIHPIRHLLLINFLGKTVEIFNGLDNKRFQPFGQAPFPCLNKASKHYYNLVIQSVEVTTESKTRHVVGTFKCSCGFHYSRRGPDRIPEDKYKIGRIKQFGEVWIAKLKELIDEKNYSYRAAARELRADTKTIIKYATYFEKRSISFLDQSELVNKQSQWLSLIRDYPNEGVTFIRKKNPSLYIWLYRHCKEWLGENSPNKGRRDVKNKVNWEERDAGLCEQLQKIIVKMYEEVPLVKATLTNIGRRANCKSLLERHLDKLLKTKNLLEVVCESIEDFQIRRIRYVITKLALEKREIKIWRVIRGAGLRTKLHPKVEKELKRLVFELNKGGQIYG